jgi:hypothetical protein
MTARSRALVAFVASAAVVIASGIAWAATRSPGVGTDLAQVTSIRTAADSVAARGPQRPAVPSPASVSSDGADESESPAAAGPTDIPVVDATEIVVPEPTPPPRSVRIAGVDVTMPVIATGVADDGQMELPEDPSVLGWYRFGASPGDRRGSAVLGGHVDSIERGIGPLARLASVPVGERIVVTGPGGKRLTYQVTDVERIAKAALPVDTIFRPGGPHQLVVVTCGGRYLPDAGGYEDNIVVTARPVAV